MEFGKGGVLVTITLFKFGEPGIQYLDPTNVIVENGILSFYWTKEISGKKQKIVTSLPFLIQHDMNGL